MKNELIKIQTIKMEESEGNARIIISGPKSLLGMKVWEDTMEVLTETIKVLYDADGNVIFYIINSHCISKNDDSMKSYYGNLI